MAQPPKKRPNEPELRPIIVKKIIVDGHGGHHGGAWKVAYADFVTAMMAFFLLMWLLGATTEKQRKGLADYFTPTLVQMKMDSAGSNGMFGGDSMTRKENYPTTGGQGNLAITIPRDNSGTRDVGGEDLKDQDRKNFQQIKRTIQDKLSADKALRKLRRHIKFTETREGLRIDLIDQADFAMFQMGTATLLPEARELIAQVAKSISGLSNQVVVRGHTDSLPYSSGQSMNNWMLSSARAESTRALLGQNGIAADRFLRIEGVADRDPYVSGDRYDPRNRRMSVVLSWSQADGDAAKPLRGKDPLGLNDKASGPSAPSKSLSTEIKQRIATRESRMYRADEQVRRLDLGRTALPSGASFINPDDAPKQGGSTSKPIEASH